MSLSLDHLQPQVIYIEPRLIIVVQCQSNLCRGDISKMVGLLDLSSEMLEQVFLQQDDAEDMISLGSSCSRLHQVISKPNIWRNLLAKAKMVTVIEDKKNNTPRTEACYMVNSVVVKMLMEFLKTVGAQKLLGGILHETICELYPGTFPLVADMKKEHLPGSSVTVRCCLKRCLHCVSVLGLQLLAITGGEGASQKIITVQLEEPASLLGTLSSLVALQEAPVAFLWMKNTISCSTEEEGKTLGSLLNRFGEWTLETLVLEGGVARGTWDLLGRAATCGRLWEVRTDQEVVMRGRQEDVIRLRSKTRRAWLVAERQAAWRQGAKRIQYWIKKFLFLNLAAYFFVQLFGISFECFERPFWIIVNFLSLLNYILYIYLIYI